MNLNWVKEPRFLGILAVTPSILVAGGAFVFWPFIGGFGWISAIVAVIGLYVNAYVMAKERSWGLYLSGATCAGPLG